ncbi:hypothetical protein M3P05_09215 [Sansalvadorimonas sp. 2012CJ34-2]|uniref:Uncharacterized protein n=1 Tax=Parendozoicomonas callyspongiae TaxID=2942213 RepID=A0ABT0PFS0_9GAMM|nr:hypothetical protein [Sansalvadorimonas sp. 2012CJ34-2]MCL6270111.1 hypothetical protein [Sansalvadorimonas sp. 2012CJ34-2]
MSASKEHERALLATRIFLNALIPVMKVVVADDPKMSSRFEEVNARVRFIVREGEGILGTDLVFKDGIPVVDSSMEGQPDITLTFKSAEKFNGFMAGKPVIPSIKGWNQPVLLFKVISLLLAMKILMPDARPKDPDKQQLKVKMILYMITTALSQYNKGGDSDMQKWTGKQPDRIYQLSVTDTDEDIAAYLRVKAGKTKAGRGFYTRRRPFVHIRFKGIEGAMPVLLGDMEFVEAVGREYVNVEGSPEYATNLNDFMQRIQALIV